MEEEEEVVPDVTAEAVAEVVDLTLDRDVIVAAEVAIRHPQHEVAIKVQEVDENVTVEEEVVEHHPVEEAEEDVVVGVGAVVAAEAGARGKRRNPKQPRNWTLPWMNIG